MYTHSAVAETFAHFKVTSYVSFTSKKRIRETLKTYGS